MSFTLVTVILFIFFKYLSSNCFLYNEESSNLCNFCSYSHYTDINYYITNKMFDPLFCIPKNESKIELKIYIYSNNINIPKNKSYYYNDLTLAFIKTWEQIQKFKYNNITFYLLGETHDFSLENLPNIVLLNIFRRFSGNITLKPLKCIEEYQIGCFSNSTYKPIIYFRSISIGFFVSGKFKIENVIFSGLKLINNECDFSNFNVTELDNNKTCSEKKNYFPIFEKRNGTSFIFIEYIIDCDYCKRPIVDLINVEFEFINTISNFSYLSLITLYVNSFEINILNSNFQYIYFTFGLIKTDYQEEFYGEQLPKSKNDFIVIKFINSRIINFNYFTIANTGVNSIFLFDQIRGNFTFENCIFKNIFKNKDDINFETTILSISYISSPNFDNIIAFTNNTFENISYKIIFRIDNLNLKNKLINMIFKNSYLKNVREFTFIKGVYLEAKNNVIVDIINFRYFVTYHNSVLNFTQNSLMYFLPINIGSTTTAPRFLIRYGDNKLSNIYFSDLIFYNFIMSIIKEESFTANYACDNFFIKNCIFLNYYADKIMRYLMNLVVSNLQIIDCIYTNLTANQLFMFTDSRYIEIKNSNFTDIKSDIVIMPKVAEYVKITFAIEKCIFYNIFPSQVMFFFGQTLMIVNNVNFKKIRNNFSFNIFMLAPFILLINSTNFIDTSNSIIFETIRESQNEYISDSVTLIINSNFYLNHKDYVIQSLIRVFFYQNCSFSLKNSKFIGNEFLTNLTDYPFHFIITNSYLQISNCIFMNLFTSSNYLIVINSYLDDNFLIDNVKFINNYALEASEITIIITKKLNFYFERILNYLNNSNLKISKNYNNITEYCTKILSYSFLCDIFMKKQFFNITQQVNQFGITNIIIACSHVLMSLIFIEYDSNVFLKNVSFYKIITSFDSSIYLASNTNSLILDCHFYEVKSKNSGGCFFFDNLLISLLELTTTNSTFSKQGGVIKSLLSEIIISSCFFYFSEGEDMGGVIYTMNSNITMHNSIFKNSSSFVSGGQIYSISSKLIIYNCYFLYSNAYSGGSIFLYRNSKLIVYLTIFSYIFCEVSPFYFSDSSFVLLEALIQFIEANYLISLKRGNASLDNIYLFDNEVKKIGININFSPLIIVNNSRFLDSFYYNSIFFSMSVETFLIYNIIMIKIDFFGFLFLINYQSNILKISNSFFWSLENFDFESSPINYFVYSHFSKIIVIYNSILISNNFKGGILIQDSTKLNIYYCLFFYLYEINGAALNIKRCDILIYNCTFMYNIAKNFGGSIYIIDGSIEIINTFFDESNSDNYGSIIYAIRSETKKEVNFSGMNITVFRPNEKCIYINFYNFFEINQFTMIEKLHGNSYYELFYFLNVENIDFSQLKMENLYFKGLLFNFSNSEFNYISNINFYNSNIYNCIGDEYFKLSGKFNLIFNNSNLFNNTYSQFIDINCVNNCFVTFFLSNFKNNLGLTYNNLFFLYNEFNLVHFKFDYDVEQKIFSSNNYKICYYTGKLKSNEIEKISKDEIELNSEQIILIKAKSNQKISFTIIIYDIYFNYLKYENGKIELSKSDQFQDSYMYNSIGIVSNGMSFFDNFSIIANPGLNITLDIIYTDKELKRYNFNKKMLINIHFCELGEELMMKQCVKCEKNYYSLFEINFYSSVNMKICLECEKNAICNGYNSLIPIEGYWRSSKNSSLIVKCKIKSICPEQTKMLNLGDKAIKYKYFIYDYICKIGHTGNLCNKCVKGYEKYGGTEYCIMCSDSLLSYLRFVLISVAMIVFFIFQTFSSFSFSVNKSKIRCFLNIFVDHSSYLIIISRFKIEWNNIGQFVFKVFDELLTTSPIEIFSFKCFLEMMEFEKSKIYLINYIMISISPIYYELICFFFWYLSKMIWNTIKNNKSKIFKISLIKKDLLILFLIIFYSFFPRLMLNAFQFFKCIEIDSSNLTYFEDNLEIECWKEEHISYILFIVLPSIVIWGGITPFLIYPLNKSLTKMKESGSGKRKSFKELDKILIFLTIDYKKEKIYWESYKYIEKMILIALSVGITRFDAASQGACIMIFFVTCCFIYQQNLPYKFKIINSYKMLSFLIIFLSTGLAIISSFYNDEHQITAFSDSLLIIINSAFFFIIFFWIIKNYLKEYGENIRILSGKISKIANKSKRFKEKNKFLQK